MAKVISTRFGYVVELNGQYYMSSSAVNGFKFTRNYRMKRNFNNYAMAQMMADDINEAIKEEV